MRGRDEENRRRRQRRDVLAFALMCVGFFMALLDVQIVASSLADIGGGLSTGKDDIGWVQTAYLIAEIVVVPLSGWLTRVFSTRWLFTGSALGFTITSILCGYAWNIESMIIFRVLQGVLGASMIPTVYTSAFFYFEGQRRLIAVAVLGCLASLAPTLGPVVGGWITDTLDWHWLFFINLFPGAIVTLGVAFLVDIDRPDLNEIRTADFAGIALLAIWLGTLEYVLEDGARWNWFADETIRRCAAISAISFVLFVARSLTYSAPVVDLRALRNRNFLLGCIISLVTGIGIFSTIYLTPLFLGYIRELPAWQTGIAMAATGIASLAGVPVYIVLVRRLDPRWLMMAGLASFGIATWLFSFITHDWGKGQLLLPQIFRGFPQIFAVAPCVTLGLGSLPQERLKYASGLFNMMRNLGGAIGIALSSAMLNDETNRHFLTIASRLTPTNTAMTASLDAMTARLAALDGSLQAGRQAALEQLHAIAFREASTMAFADAFRAIMVVFLVTTPLVLLMRKVTS
jgi:DHA2 family multidrug resistance protein